MPPKLSTACSHAAELDKVLSMNFLQNYLSGFRTTYLTQRLHRATWAPVWLSPHPSPPVPQRPQSSSNPPWVSHPFARGCPPSYINFLCTESSDQFALNRKFTLLFQISRTAQLRLSPTIPPWVSPRNNFHQWSQSLVTGEHGGVPFDSPPPSLLVGCRRLPPRTKRNSYDTVSWNLLRSQAEKDPFCWKPTENAPKIKHNLQPCCWARQSVINEFSSELSEWF